MALIYPDKIKIGNVAASGIVDILEVAGSRQVATKADLYTLSGAILSSSFDITTGEGNVNNDAIGIEFYVVDEGTFYYLTDWSKRGEADGWSTRAVGEATSETAGTVIVSTDESESRDNAVYTAAKTRDLISAAKTELTTEIDKKVDTESYNTTIATLKTKEEAASEKQALEGQIALKANAADVYTKGEVDAKVSSVYKVKGSVASEEALPTEGNVVGDVYNTEDTGDNFVWTEAGWDKLAGIVDLSAYLKSDDAVKTYATIESLNTAKSDLNTEINKKVAKSDFEAYQGTVTTALSNKVENTVFTEEVGKLQTKADAKTESERVDAAIALKADITSLNSTKSELETKITTLETNVGNTYQTKAEAATEHETISNEIGAVEEALGKEIDELSSGLAGHGTRLDGIDQTLLIKADTDKVVPITRTIAGHALSADVTLSKSDVGLANVDNTSDAKKPISEATQAALDLKANDADVVHNTITVNGHALSANVEVTAADLGLDKVNNTADLDKPISTATQAALDKKADASELSKYVTIAGEETITGKKIFTEVSIETLEAGSLTLDSLVLEGTTEFSTLPTYTGEAEPESDSLITKAHAEAIANSAAGTVTKESLGLDKVSNTADLDKPISTATQSALDLKANDADVVKKTVTVNGHALSSDIEVTASDVGLGKVDNTTDLEKPISTATQAALNTKADDTDVVHNTGDEMIEGVKTFTSLPVVPTTVEGVSSNNVASVAYVTSAISKVTSEGIATIRHSEDNPELESDNGVCTWVVTHNLNSDSVLVQLREVSSKCQVFADVEYTSVNTCTIKINSTETIPASTYHVSVV